MNENHTHDKELLEKVERLVNQGQPSGNRLLDDLAAMKPRAKADFQQELENRLTASLYSQHLEMKEKPALSTLTLKPEMPSRKFAAIPVTLAAAIAAVLLMSTVLLWQNLPPHNSLNSSIAQAATLTSTPLPLATTTAIALETAFVPIENPILSDDQARATALIVGATQTVEAQIAVQLGPIFVPPNCEYYLPTSSFSVRSEPSFNAAVVVGSVYGSTAICVTGFVAGLDDDHQWAMVNLSPQFPNGSRGYARADFLALIPEGIPISAPIEFYTVREGDTLLSIAAQFGVEITAIVDANGLSQIDTLQVGQDLFISLPQPTPRAYVSVPYAGGGLELQAVVIAMTDIPLGTVLTVDMLGVAYYPVDIAPFSSFIDPSTLVGMAVMSPVGRYQPLLADSVTDQIVELPDAEIVPPDVSALLPPGTVAVPIPIDSIVGEISAGLDGENFTIIIAGDNARTVENAQIIYISDAASREFVVLAVSPEDAEMLVVAVETLLPLSFIEADSDVAREVITTTFDYGGHVSSTSTTAAAEMQRAGMTWMQIQITYTPNMDTSQAEAAINEAHARGFRILLTIVGDVSDMGASDYVANYAAYLGQVAALNPDAIEVWSEANIDLMWTTGDINGASYVNMLRQAYQAIKVANSEVMVISGAPAPTGAGMAFPDSVMNDDQWISEVVAAGGLDYMDCLGAHYVEGVVSPNQIDGDPRDDHYTRYFLGMLDSYWNLTRGERPICFTSFGYLSPEGYGSLDFSFTWASDTTVAQQASWLVSAAQMSSQSGRVRLLMVWNIDFTTYASSNPTAGYAIIRADGSCPACDAFAVARNPNPVGAATPEIGILNEMMEDGRVRITFAADEAALIWALNSQVDVFSLVYGSAITETGATVQIMVQRIVSNAEITFNEDETISLVLELGPVSDALNLTLATTPIMILPARADETLEPVGAFQRRDNAFTGFFITIPVSSVTTTIDQLELYDPISVDVSLEGAGSPYHIEGAQYWGSDREGTMITIALHTSIDAGVLSWVEQGDFSVTITEAQP